MSTVPKLRAGKIIFLAVITLVLASTASANSIIEEDVRIDVAESQIDARIEVAEITANAFTYITTTEVNDVQASIDGEPVECTTRAVALGSEIRCDTNKSENFTVEMSYSTELDIEEQINQRIFRHQHPIYRPTDKYSLEVLLPEGTALAQGENISQIISPLEADIETVDGRQISITWSKNPSLGETMTFYIIYEDFKPSEGPAPINLTEILLLLTGLAVIGFSGWYLRRRFNSEKIKLPLPDLDEEEQEVLEILMDNDGEYLQKDVVNELDYSKAKVSGIVSDLVEKEILEKTKDGRSNKLVIPKKYVY